jgi:hypothetical protein
LKKNPKFKNQPTPSKVAKRSSITDPEKSFQDFPHWRFGKIDFDGFVGWGRISSKDIIKKVLSQLKNYESMKWSEILTKPHCHSIKKSVICKEAIGRLKEIYMDDIDDLFQLVGTDQKCRIWGIRNNHIFYFLWWDPNHLVYPTEKKNT